MANQAIERKPGPGRITNQLMPKWRIWLLASRPPTLPAAVVPVVVGSAAAAYHGLFRPGVMIAALLSALFIQIGTNLANDLFDFRKGADTEKRLGPTRVTQAGLLTEGEVFKGMVVTFALAALFGLYLVAVAGWPIFVVGLVSIAMGILYTGGPWAYGYRGLGDVFAFLFFGPVAVIGTYYVHTLSIDRVAVVASIPVALLVTAILIVNNLRDIDTDRATGKRTLAVRIGAKMTRYQYLLFVLISYIVPIYLWLSLDKSFFWLPWLTLPIGIRMVRLIFTETGRALNRGLKGTGMLHLAYGLLFAGGLIL